MFLKKKRKVQNNELMRAPRRDHIMVEVLDVQFEVKINATHSKQTYIIIIRE